MTSIKAFIDGAYIAAQARLLRQVHAGAILFVEGDTDAKIFNRFVDSTVCQIEVSFGKKNAIDALDMLEDEGFPGVLAVVDADFDRLLGTDYTLDGLFLTDAHDLDLTLFASPALEVYLAEHAEPDAIQKNFSGSYSNVRQKVIEVAATIGYYRLASFRRGLRVSFKKLQHQDIIALDSLGLDRARLVSETLSQSFTPCRPEDFERYSKIEASKGSDVYQIANGHDVAAILGLALRSLLARRRDTQTWASEIEAGLRLAFDREAFTATKLYNRLKGWETANSPFKIFRPA